MYKLGDKVKYNPPQKGIWTIKEIIEAPFALEWTWFLYTCPHCQREVNETKIHQIYRVEVLTNDKGYLITMGYTVDGRYMRLPDESFHTHKSMTQAIKKKSSFMKKRKVKKEKP